MYFLTLKSNRYILIQPGFLRIYGFAAKNKITLLAPIIRFKFTHRRLAFSTKNGAAFQVIIILKAIRGVAIFAKACFGHPSPSTRQKLNAAGLCLRRPDVLRTCHFALPSYTRHWLRSTPSNGCQRLLLAF